MFENCLVASTLEAVASTESSCSPSLKTAREMKFRFLTGCCNTTARPVSQEHAYFVVPAASPQSFDAYASIPATESQPMPLRVNGLIPPEARTVVEPGISGAVLEDVKIVPARGKIVAYGVPRVSTDKPLSIWKVSTKSRWLASKILFSLYAKVPMMLNLFSARLP